MKERFNKNSYVKEGYYRVMEELLEKKEFSDITTTEIIERSGLSRATFYKHFRDKFELAAWKFGELFSLAFKNERYTTIEGVENRYRESIHYICERKNIFKSMLKYSGQNSFEEFYYEHAKKDAEDYAAANGRSLSALDYYTIKYHSKGAVQVLKDWILSNDSVTVQEICDLLIKNRSESLADLYVIKKTSDS